MAGVGRGARLTLYVPEEGWRGFAPSGRRTRGMKVGGFGEGMAHALSPRIDLLFSNLVFVASILHIWLCMRPADGDLCGLGGRLLGRFSTRFSTPTGLAPPLTPHPPLPVPHPARQATDVPTHIQRRTTSSLDLVQINPILLFIREINRYGCVY